jgi:hypothetical protein
MNVTKVVLYSEYIVLWSIVLQYYRIGEDGVGGETSVSHTRICTCTLHKYMYNVQYLVCVHTIVHHDVFVL